MRSRKLTTGRLTSRIFNADKCSNVKNKPSDVWFMLTIPLLSGFSCCHYQRTYKASDWKGRSPATKFLSIFAKPNANRILESSDAYRLISLALGSKDVAKGVQTWPNPWKNPSASSDSRISVLDLVRTLIEQ